MTTFEESGEADFLCNWPLNNVGFGAPTPCAVENPDARDPGLIPGSGRSPGEGNGNLLQYAYLGNPVDRGAWQAAVQGATQSGTMGERSATFRSALCICAPGAGASQPQAACCSGAVDFIGKAAHKTTDAVQTHAAQRLAVYHSGVKPSKNTMPSKSAFKIYGKKRVFW